jgi:hypothetical protein
MSAADMSCSASSASLGKDSDRSGDRRGFRALGDIAPERLQYPLSHTICSSEAVGRVEDNRELVTAQSRRIADVGKLPLQDQPDPAQKRIASGVAVQVVHLLELVEVYAQDAATAAVAPRPADPLVEPSAKAHAVWQPGKRIMVSEEAYLLLGLLADRYVPYRDRTLADALEFNLMGDCFDRNLASKDLELSLDGRVW